MNKTHIMQISKNFEFLRPFHAGLADLGGFAEAIMHIDPGSALTRLRNFAEALTKAIHKEERIPKLPQASFFEMLRHPAFEACVNRSLIYQLDYIRKNGNETAHGAEGELRTAQLVLATAHQLAMYLGIRYYGIKKQDIPPFEDIPDPRGELKALKKSVKDYKEALETKAEEVDKLLDELDKERASAQQTDSTEVDWAASKEKSQAAADSLQWNEAKTRAQLIDTMLLQAGWDLNDKEQVTFEEVVEHQPNQSGKGRADYVLWAENGKPLAVIEAKRASKESIQDGREQARMYADGLEKMTGQRPVIFYTNGYETYLWDDVQYGSDRMVYGFYSRESLAYLLYQRQYRKAEIEQFNPDLSIAGRSYQIEAIKAVAKRFQDQRRKSLIVQATGTGKTRVAIAISELLLRTNWAKRILFLCDRKELRRQADNAYKIHLPSEPRCVIGETNKVDQSARIFIATYPGMMNRFQQLDIGFFDLIVSDESHRSIYNKYRDIFDYFDALQLGLTATPVHKIVKNTYELFGCEDKDPTFNYSLDDAINNEPPFLVPFRVKDLTTEFLREGIHYNDLSREQQEQLEQELGEETAQTTTIAGKDIGRKIYSIETDTIILENLMNNGIKDATGTLPGKTIVFAQNQKHADHLESLFKTLYPQYGNKVCKVIHNKVTRAEALIDEFKTADNEFRIAISVDMLDTGIDVPEIVNLVFAKPVKSWVKFWQMIGRGTRLCPDLFGAGKDKTEFLIFDHYSNFSYFEEDYQEAEEQQGRSILQHLFESRLNLLEAAITKNHRGAFDRVSELIREDINDLPEKSINVKKHLRTVHQLTQTDALEEMEVATRHQLSQIIAPLMGSRILRDKDAIDFDRLIAELEICLVQQASCLEDLKQELLSRLDKLAVTIKAVRNKDIAIDTVRGSEFWQNLSIQHLEYARVELRGIMKYRSSGSGPGTEVGTTSIKDGDDIRYIERQNILSSQTEAMQYRRKIKKVLDNMLATNPVLQKIHNNRSVPESELKTLTSTILAEHPGVDLKTLNQFYGRTARDLNITIKEIIGIDPQVIEQHFTAFLHSHPRLTHQQVQFMNLLKQYLSEHGCISIEKLYESPFTSVSHEGLDGVFKEQDVNELVTVLKPYIPLEQTQ